MESKVGHSFDLLSESGSGSSDPHVPSPHVIDDSNRLVSADSRQQPNRQAMSSSRSPTTLLMVPAAPSSINSPQAGRLGGAEEEKRRGEAGEERVVSVKSQD